MPKVKALPVLFFSIAALWLCSSGCAKKYADPLEPLEVMVRDIPQDDGSNVIIGWRHFKASAVKQYDVYYSMSRDSIENPDLRKKLTPLVKTPQSETASLGDTLANKVSNLDYYIVLDKSKGGIPKAIVVKGSDPMSAQGEKILAVEHELYPIEKSTLELVRVDGNYYRIKPPKEQPEPILRTLDDISLVRDSAGISAVGGKDAYIFTTNISEEEKEFIEAGDRISAFDPGVGSLMMKYGQHVFSFVTEKTRYTMKSDKLQVAIRKTLKPGVNYYYKIVAQNAKKKKVETEIDSFVPVDDPPMPAVNTIVLQDTLDGKNLAIWMGYNSGLAAFRDVDKYELRRLDPKDAERTGGELIGEYGADYSAVYIEGDFAPTDLFYIATFDKAGQRVTSEPFGIMRTELKEPKMVEQLSLVDAENDDGKALSIRWGKPTIKLEYTVIEPSPRYEEFPIPGNYYLIPTENGDRLVKFAEGDTNIPKNALKIINARKWIRAEKYNLTVRYRKLTNKSHDALYAELAMDTCLGGFEDCAKRIETVKPKKDFHELGTFIFQNLPAKQYIFKSTLLDSKAKKLENAEATIIDTLTIEQPGITKREAEEAIVEIWRANAEIQKKVKGKIETWLTGTPHFDPKNKAFFELVAQRSIFDMEHTEMWQDSLRDKGEYYYFVRVIGADGSYAESEIMGPMTPTSNIFHKKKAVVLILVILFVFFVNFFLISAKKGKKFYLRTIAGIAHIDEALGRATEMGRPLLYVLGLSGISDIATLAGITILGRVAKKSAEFQTRILVPCVDPIVLIVAQETVKTACMDAGRPDVFREEDVFYAAGSQFSYAAAVSGLMLRHRTAANFYMGMFFAEALILTETGSMAGSIQIAGTDAVTQIPFFITTCDYTLIGEELYAASAYLSRDPLQVGSLKAQDMLKAIYMVLIVIGTIAMTSGFMWFINLFKMRIEE